jgi:aspartate oxidase
MEHIVIIGNGIAELHWHVTLEKKNSEMIISSENKFFLLELH